MMKGFSLHIREENVYLPAFSESQKYLAGDFWILLDDVLSIHKKC